MDYTKRFLLVVVLIILETVELETHTCKAKIRAASVAPIIEVRVQAKAIWMNKG